MTFGTLIRRSLRFHWRAHLGVVLGAAVGSAALIGALVVGDSVKGSLRDSALARLGRIDIALDGQDRFIRETLVNDLGRVYSPVLRVSGSVNKSDASARANRVQVLGVRSSIARFSNVEKTQSMHAMLRGAVAMLNSNLASHLKIAVGDTILLRVGKPTALASEAAISSKSGLAVVMRLRVVEIASDDELLGQFSLQSGSTPYNVFVPLDYLQQELGRPGRVNLVLASGATPDQSATRLRGLWQLADPEVEFANYASENMLELRTPRVFLDPPLARAALAANANARPTITFLVNLLRAGTNTTPYSMVTAAGAPWTPSDLRDDEIVISQWLAEDLRVKPGDEIATSYFLPESGAKLTEATNIFRIHSVVPLEMPWADRTLMPDFPGIEKTESTRDWDAGFPLTYKIRPKDEDYWKKYRGTPKAFITLAAGQKMWGNRFGNLTAIRFPIPTNVTTALTPGERENRSQSPTKPESAGSSTASEKSEGEQRLSPLPGGEGQGESERQTNPVGTRSTAFQTSPKDGDAVERVPTSVEDHRTALEKKILASLKPEELGLRFEPVREQALKAAAESQDFGGLFLGFSFFLIIAALLLMAMLFQFGLEQRAPEIGTLLALGFTPKQVRNLLLREGVALAFLGGVLGAVGGIYFAKVMLHGLTTIWRDAVGTTALNFHYTGQTLAIGIFASVVVSVVTIWLALRKFVKRPARELLVGEIGTAESKVQNLKSKGIAMAALLVGLALVGRAVVSGDTANAGIFFGAGALVLVAGLSFVSVWLANFASGAAFPLTPALFPSEGERENHGQSIAESGTVATSFTLGSLAVRGCARRRKRSLATIAMLACGSFLIVSIGVFRLDANRDSTKRDSGTGRFALIGETTMPVVQDLNSKTGREFFALNETDLNGVNFVPFRVHEGDEASCLNLNRAQKPRLLGVKPEWLSGRFTFDKLMAGTDVKTSEWSLLSKTSVQDRAPVERDEIPAIGDANSIQWAMHKKVGDTIDYVDERGQPFKVRIVGAVANSILQGQLIFDEAEFVKRFPGESGYRMFLIDAPSNAVSQVSATLSRAMQDVGLELTPALQRLAQFNAVQNTYLGTFQVLGGLGLLLGSVGLGIVVLRNVLERRGELAVLMAVGFRKATLQRLLLMENGALLVLGLAVGVVAAAVAVLPAMLSPSAQLPYASLALTLAAVLVNGALWTWAATRIAVRGDLLAALRNE